MPEERRENDKIILEEIRSLQTDVGGIKVNLALNTQETARLAQYQEKMNGRMVGHEARMQAVEGAQALTATTLAQMQVEDKNRKEKEKKQEDRNYETHDRWKWVVIGILVSAGGQILLYLIKSDVLKKIFTQ
jgi:hypothetical protein